MLINKINNMKEVRYLVFFDKLGYYSNKQSKETEDWTFTQTISESKKHKTIHGAFVRLEGANDISKLKDVNRGILVEQTETTDNKEIVKIIAKLSYKTMDKTISEKEIEQTELVIEPTKQTKQTKETVELTTTIEDKPTIDFETSLKTKEMLDQMDQSTETLVKERETVNKVTEPLTSTIEEESTVKVAKISAEDSFWDN